MTLLKSRIREFYEETFLPQIRQLANDNKFHTWRDNPQICLGYLQLGSLEFINPENPAIDDYKLKLDYVRVRRLPETIPSTVLDSFNHHFFASQTRLVDIFVLRVPVDTDDTYAIFINGYVDDGWDQVTEFLEVYDNQGILVGSDNCPFDEDFTTDWEDRSFTIDDYDYHYDEEETGQIWLEDDIEYID